MAQKKAVAKKRTQTREKANEREQTDFSFNLLTESWLPVISLKKEKQFLNLNEFLKNAHTLERFDFPLPGLETAVIRFLVALVHIVGAPETLKQWEERLLKGKFEGDFIKELNEKYSDKLDLFSKKDPFMQEVVKDEKFKKHISKLIDEFPSGNNSLHFSNRKQKSALSNEIYVSTSAGVALLLYANMTPRSGLGGFLSGVINAKTPYFILIKGKNLFESVYLNVIHQSYFSKAIDSKELGPNSNSWSKKFKGETTPNKINIQDGLLWKSRSILLVPSKGSDNYCALTGKKSNILVKELYYAPQVANLKTKTLWNDPYNGINKIKNEVKKNSPPGKTMPSWKDYPSFILFEANQIKKTETIRPLVLDRFLHSTISKKYDVALFVFGVSTKQDKVFQASENSFPFSPKFVEIEGFSNAIKYFTYQTFTFERNIRTALTKSFIKDSEKINPDRKRKIAENINNSFQSSYWHEIGSEFEISLSKLANSNEEDINLIINDWNELLANHVRKTFYKHTEKLISNPKNLKQYQAGNKFLEKQVQNILLRHKRKSK